MAIKVFYCLASDQDRIYWSEQPDPLLAAMFMDALTDNQYTTPLGWTWGTHEEFAQLLALRGGQDWGFDFQAIALPPALWVGTTCVTTSPARPGDYFHGESAYHLSLTDPYRDHVQAFTVAIALERGMRPCPTCFPTLGPVMMARPATETDR